MKFEIKTDLGYHITSMKNKVLPKKGDFITYKEEDYIVKNVCHNYDSNKLEVFVSSYTPSQNHCNDLIKKEITEMNEKLILAENMFKTINELFDLKKSGH